MGYTGHYACVAYLHLRRSEVVRCRVLRELLLCQPAWKRRQWTQLEKLKD